MDENEKNLDAFIDSYWNYFLELENEFANTQKYVAFDMCNKGTYSIEYLKLYQAVCSEIDVLGKEILLHFEPSFKTDGMVTIIHWGYGITKYMHDSLDATVMFAGKIELRPWVKFGYERYTKKNKNKKDSICYKLEKDCEKPKWWKDYNQVKHARTSNDEAGHANYQRANFGNLVQAFAALYILEVFYAGVLEEKAEPYGVSMDSKLFSLRLDRKKPDTENETSMAGAM